MSILLIKISSFGLIIDGKKGLRAAEKWQAGSKKMAEQRQIAGRGF